MTRTVWSVVAVLTCFAATALLLSPSFAEDPKPRGQLYQHWKRIGLSEEQITQIYKIQASHRAKIDKLEEEIKALKKEERAEAEKVLTAAQRARLREILTGEEKPTDKPVKEKPATEKPAVEKPATPKDKP